MSKVREDRFVISFRTPDSAAYGSNWKKGNNRWAQPMSLGKAKDHLKEFPSGSKGIIYELVEYKEDPLVPATIRERLDELIAILGS